MWIGSKCAVCNFQLSGGGYLPVQSRRKKKSRKAKYIQKKLQLLTNFYCTKDANCSSCIIIPSACFRRGMVRGGKQVPQMEAGFSPHFIPHPSWANLHLPRGDKFSEFLDSRDAQKCGGINIAPNVREICKSNMEKKSGGKSHRGGKAPKKRKILTQMHPASLAFQPAGRPQDSTLPAVVLMRWSYPWLQLSSPTRNVADSHFIKKSLEILQKLLFLWSWLQWKKNLFLEPGTEWST